MLETNLYTLWGKKRLFQFPYRIATLGWMPHHYHEHHNALLENCYVCISANWEDSVMESVVNGTRCTIRVPDTKKFLFAILKPGTTIQSIRTTYHDELFFSYPPECYELFLQLFRDTLHDELHFYFDAMPSAIVAKIREELNDLEAPGAADRLDQLAIQLFTAIITDHVLAQEKTFSRNSIKINSIAGELGSGVPLDDLLKKYGISRRTFYREWEYHFSVSPTRYRLQEQIRRACQMLQNTAMSHGEIAALCGFKTVNYFYQKFKQETGVSPGEYRQTPKMF